MGIVSETFLRTDEVSHGAYKWTSLSSNSLGWLKNEQVSDITRSINCSGIKCVGGFLYVRDSRYVGKAAHSNVKLAGYCADIFSRHRGGNWSHCQWSAPKPPGRFASDCSTLLCSALYCKNAFPRRLNPESAWGGTSRKLRIKWMTCLNPQSNFIHRKRTTPTEINHYLLLFCLILFGHAWRAAPERRPEMAHWLTRQRRGWVLSAGARVTG